MGKHKQKCLLCGMDCTSDDGYYTHDPSFPLISCSQCGQYISCESALEDFSRNRTRDTARLCALLYERRVTRHANVPLLLVLSSDEPLRECVNESGENWAEPVRVPELLAAWPVYGHEQIDRALLLLSNTAPTVGCSAYCSQPERAPATWFAENETQASFVMDALATRGLIEIKDLCTGTTLPTLRLTLRGWERVAELSRTRTALTNPAFVARWFGKPKPGDPKASDRSDEMQRLVDEAIVPAISAAGYRATKADSEDYNTGIMDKVLHDIRRAPFVVADFTGHNLGVYYEVGVAVGEGIDVIPCCPRSEFKEKHFDIAHVYFVLYDSQEDLRVQLERRILGSIGEGPFPKNGDAGRT